jgi:DNA modification methylase
MTQTADLVLKESNSDTHEELLVSQFISAHAIPYQAERDDYRREPLSLEVKSGKNTLIYNVHSYPTKVPYQAILPFIEHYTKPGDLVLDPFCGSGMIGVAAVMASRNAVLIDVAPSAAHIAYNYVTPCDAHSLSAAGHQLLSAVARELSCLYATLCDRCKGPATIEYSVWSDIFECKNCSKEICYWDVAVDRSKGSVRKIFECPYCEGRWRKQDLRWKSSIPVSSKYSCTTGCRGMVERQISGEEFSLSHWVENEPVVDWYPTTPFGPDREMWRGSHQVMGIRSVDSFYTRRNLRVLAALWREIQRVSEDHLRSALTFAFTATVNRASRRYQWNAKRPTNVQTGTLYISSLNYEWNVMSLFRRKLAGVVQFYKAYPSFPGKALVVNGSATRLEGIPNGSIDYIFADPPFGSNIYYADCALLWESWLDNHTDEREEVVVNSKRKQRTGGKSLADYQTLITEAFTQMYQVLKPGRWASVVFHSSHPDVWRALQDSIRDAGFDLTNTCALDKGQPSIKGLKGRRDEEWVPAIDVILNLHKRQKRRTKSEKPPEEMDVRAFLLETIRTHLASLPARVEAEPEVFSDEQRRTQYLHSLAVRALLNRQFHFKEVSYGYIEQLCQEHFEMRDGYWFLRGEDKYSDPLLEQPKLFGDVRG